MTLHRIGSTRRRGAGVLVVGAVLALALGLGGNAVAAPAGSHSPAQPIAAANSGPGQGWAQRMVPGAPVTPPPARKAQPAAAAQYRQFTAYYGPVTIGPNSWMNSGVYCPSGMQVTDGGEENTSSGDISLNNDYALADNSGWQVVVTNFGSIAETFTVYAVCWSGIANYGPVIAKASVPSGGFNYALANCPSSGQVLGGGGFMDTIYSSVDSGTVDQSWEFGMQNNDSVTHTVNSQVFCGNDVTNYRAVWGPGVILGPGQEGSDTAYCPAGTWVVGGGGYPAEAGVFRMTDSLPIYTNQGWEAFYHNDGSSSDQLFAKVICGN
ncbi:MAG TPA: hypothetical protein VGM75_25465 [Pseudonocardiaceae bacterium]|jgi:hypothetical protein